MWVECGVFADGRWWTVVVVVGVMGVGVVGFSGVLVVGSCDGGRCWWSGVVGCGVSPWW